MGKKAKITKFEEEEEEGQAQVQEQEATKTDKKAKKEADVDTETVQEEEEDGAAGQVGEKVYLTKQRRKKYARSSPIAA